MHRLTADEVERDVLGHIETELAGQPEPVDAGQLLDVLDRLGGLTSGCELRLTMHRDCRPTRARFQRICAFHF
jgi:hypothetical protein